MEKMPSAKKAIDFLMNFFEIIIPSIALFVMFCVFVAQVFMRYVFDDPLTWSFELTLFLYVYIVMFGACYALRENEHVCFSMVYDDRSKKTQAIMRITETCIVLIIFIAAMPSVIDYAWIQKIASLKKTAVLQIPYKFLYLSFVFMMVTVAARLIMRTVDDIKYLRFGEREEKL